MVERRLDLLFWHLPGHCARQCTFVRKPASQAWCEITSPNGGVGPSRAQGWPTEPSRRAAISTLCPLGTESATGALGQPPPARGWRR